MNKVEIFLSAVLVGAAAPAARAYDVRALSAKSAALEADARGLSSRLEESLRAILDAKPFSDGPVPGYVDVSRARDYCARNPWPVEAFTSQARLYYMCRALAAGDPGVCEEMGPDSRVSVFYKRSDCERGWWNLRLARAVVSQSADLESICAAHSDFQAQFRAVDRARVCAALRRPDPGPLCALLKERYPDQFRHSDLSNCVSENSIFWGRNADCEAFAKTGFQFMEHQVCVAASRYRDAFSASDAARCGDCVLCRAMFGDGGACEAYMAGLRADGCRVSAAPAARPSPLTDQIEAALAATRGRPMAPVEKEAAARLHLVMTRLEPADPDLVIPDLVLLRVGAFADAQSRAAALCQALGAQAADCAPRQERLKALKTAALKAVDAFASQAGLSLDSKAYEPLFDQ